MSKKTRAARSNPAPSDATQKSQAARPQAKRAAAKRTAPTRSEWLALRPQRNPQLQWSEEDDRVILRITRQKTWKTRLLNVFFPLPPDRRVALDKIGTDVWRWLDGTRTMGQIARALADKYQLETREAELSLQQFFKELGRRGYVGLFFEETTGER